jgi:hypothetical protein
MRMVGVIEMGVGVGILSPKIEISSYAASGWLTCIAANLIMNKNYDIAVRDINMAIGAFALGRRKPFAQSDSRSERIISMKIRTSSRRSICCNQD